MLLDESGEVKLRSSAAIRRSGGDVDAGATTSIGSGATSGKRIKLGAASDRHRRSARSGKTARRCPGRRPVRAAFERKSGVRPAPAAPAAPPPRCSIRRPVRRPSECACRSRKSHPRVDLMASSAARAARRIRLSGMASGSSSVQHCPPRRFDIRCRSCRPARWSEKRCAARGTRRRVLCSTRRSRLIFASDRSRTRRVIANNGSATRRPGPAIFRGRSGSPAR